MEENFNENFNNGALKFIIIIIYLLSQHQTVMYSNAI